MIYHTQERDIFAGNREEHWYGGQLLSEHPFIHCCTETQIEMVLEKFYPSSESVILMEIEEKRLEPKLAYEGKPGEEAYPHIYGRINGKAIGNVCTLKRDKRGSFTLPSSGEAPAGEEIGRRFFRIHTQDRAYLTQRPRGLFTAVGRLVDRGTLTEREVEQYWENRTWFEANLPVPPFYGDGNTLKAITWYKNSKRGREMFQRMTFYLDMAVKYGMPLLLTQTDISPGRIVYEDEYQIGVTGSLHSGVVFATTEYKHKPGESRQ